MQRLTILLLAIAAFLILTSIGIGVFFGFKKIEIPTIDDDEGGSCESEHELYEILGPSKLGKYSRAAVAVDNEECSKIGKSILLKGGKAADAAIAASLCNGIFNSHSMGIGGGCVLVIYSKKHRKAFSIIERETAPLNVSKDIYLKKENVSLIGPLAIATPGELLAYHKLYQEFGGGVSWSALFTPTIRLCEKGFYVSRILASAIKENRKFILNDTQLREVFVKNQTTDELYQEGDLMKRIKLGQTLRKIANEGVQTFYNGSLADQIVDEIQKKGGILSKQDLSQYKVDFHEALSTQLNDRFKAYTSLSPSSGPVLLFVLNIMMGYQFQIDDWNSTEKTSLFYHRLMESFKFAFAKRAQLGDPRKTNQSELIHNLTSKIYAESIRNKINDDKTFSKEYYEDQTSESSSTGGTAHISVVDEYGDAVAITSTINTYFGSLVLGEHTGIIYNNEMDDFSIGDKANYHGSSSMKFNKISPGKRPVSSQTPLIILDNHEHLRLIIGASGGNKIITSVSYVTLLNLLFNFNIKEAIDLPRLHHHLLPDKIIYEQPFNESIMDELERRGHKFKCMPYGGSVVQAIEWNNREKQYWANSDVRKGGNSHGY